MTAALVPAAYISAYTPLRGRHGGGGLYLQACRVCRDRLGLKGRNGGKP